MYSFERVPIIGEEVGVARNLILHHAEKTGVDYVAFIDEDVIAAPNAFAFLLYMMENHPEISIIGGVYCTKSIPPTPLVYKEWQEGPYYGWKKGEFFQVKSLGLGLTVIRVKDLAQLDVETYQDRNPHTGEDYPNVRRYCLTGVTSERTETGLKQVCWTEDQYFFWKVAEAGLQVWCDSRVIADHYDWRTKNLFHVPFDSNVCKPADGWGHSPMVANLGCGKDIQDFMVNVDMNSDDPRVFKADIRALPPDWEGQFDTVRAYHCLEHLAYGEVEPTLREWFRVLKPGGILNIHVPDMEWACKRILDSGGEMDIITCGHIWGDQGHIYWRQPQYHENIHRVGFTQRSLKAMMEKVGLENVKTEAHGFEFWLVAWKPGDEAAVPSLETISEAARKE